MLGVCCLHRCLQLLTYDLATGAVEELPEDLTQALPMPNGATNWPGTDDTIVLLTQVTTGPFSGASIRGNSLGMLCPPNHVSRVRLVITGSSSYHIPHIRK